MRNRRGFGLLVVLAAILLVGALVTVATALSGSLRADADLRSLRAAQRSAVASAEAYLRHHPDALAALSADAHLTLDTTDLDCSPIELAITVRAGSDARTADVTCQARRRSRVSRQVHTIALP